MKLYYSPGACSLGIHFLLEEIGAPYEAVPVIIKQGDTLKEAYTRLNPKAKVPLLERDDGSRLSEFGAICRWLSRTIGADLLAPADLEEEVRSVETLDFIVGTIHMQGFSRILRPQKFSPSEADLDWVRAQGGEIVAKGFAHLSQQLGEAPFIMGARLSAADAALLYVLFWGIERARLDLPANLQAYYARMSARPSVVRVFRDEGLRG
ncbi:MAG TPA: glutathione S-transferase [Novosphingobium sp.]|nr:glutathione S-transferase [Novosphingobium sp.]